MHRPACLTFVALAACSAAPPQPAPASPEAPASTAAAASPATTAAPEAKLPPTGDAIHALFGEPKTFTLLEGYAVDDKCFPMSVDDVRHLPEGGSVTNNDFAEQNDPSPAGLTKLRAWLDAKLAGAPTKLVFARTYENGKQSGWGALCLKDRILAAGDLTPDQAPRRALISAPGLVRLRALDPQRKIAFLLDGQVLATGEVAGLLRLKMLSFQ